MASGRTFRQFGLGSGLFIIAIRLVLLLLEHDPVVLLVVPALTAALLLLEALRRVSTKP